MPKLSTYSPLTATPSDTDTVPITTGGATRNVPVKNLIRELYVTVGPVGTYARYICDGTADNVEISAAMTDAQATGREVYIFPGTYDMAAQIVQHNKSNITVRGSGPGRTILRRSFTGAPSMIDIGSAAGPTAYGNIIFSNLTVDQNNTGSGWGLVITWCYNVLIENCSFINQNSTSLAILFVGKFAGGSSVFEAKNIRVVDCVFDYSTASALSWEVISCVDARDVVFDRCRWVGVASVRPGLLMYNTEQATLCNSFVDHATVTIGGRGTYSVLNTRFEVGKLFLNQTKNVFVGGGTTFFSFGTTTSFFSGIVLEGGYKTGNDAETPWYIPTLDFATSSVDTATDTITLSSTTDFPTGTVVRITTTGTLPGGVASNSTDYYVINTGSTTIKLATSLANALAATAIDLTSQGGGTHTITVSTVFSCENIVIDGVIFNGTKANAIFAKTTTENGKEVLDCRDMTISNCKFEDCTGIPIVAFAERLKITDIEILDGNGDNVSSSSYNFYIAALEAQITNVYTSSPNVGTDIVTDVERFTTLLPTMKLRLRGNNFNAATKLKYFNAAGSLVTTPTTNVTVSGDDNIGINPNVTYSQGNVTGATTFNRVNGSLITATLTGNITATLPAGLVIGDTLTLKLTQDSTGSRLVTWPSNFKKANGSLALSTAANATDIIPMRYDGTNWVALGPPALGVA